MTFSRSESAPESRSLPLPADDGQQVALPPRPGTPYPEASKSEAPELNTDSHSRFSDFFLEEAEQNFLDRVQIPSAELDFGLNTNITAPEIDATPFDEKDFNFDFDLFDDCSQGGGDGSMQPPVLPSIQTDDLALLRNELHSIERAIDSYKHQ